MILASSSSTSTVLPCQELTKELRTSMRKEDAAEVSLQIKALERKIDNHKLVRWLNR